MEPVLAGYGWCSRTSVSVSPIPMASVWEN